MRFFKMQGAGNDYVYVNCFQEKPPTDLAKLSRASSAIGTSASVRTG